MATVDYEKGLIKRLQDPEYASEYLRGIEGRIPGSIHAGSPGRGKGQRDHPGRPGIKP